MLKKVRKPLSIKTFAAYIIFGMICLTFVFVGLDGNQGVSVGGVAAIVNGSVISLADFRKLVNEQEKRYSMFLKDLPPAKRRERSRSFRVQALDDLIRAEVTFQSAEEIGLVVSDSEVLDYITKMEVFQEEDRFDPMKYEQLLQYNGYTPEIFESKIRKDLLSMKLRNSFATALHVSEMESLRQAELGNSKVNLKFISFDSKDIKKNYKTQDKDIEDFLKNSLERVQQYYETHQSEFMSEEQVKARHILIKAKSGDKKAEAKALEKVKALAERAKNEDFGELASKLSEDEGSKKKKGDLGYFSRGQMVPEFEKVAFSGKIGEVSEPVKTTYGYHLIKVEGKKPTEKESFDSVKKKIAKKLIAEDAFPKVVDDLRETIKAQDTLKVDKFVKSYAFKWQDTDDFSINRENIPKMGRGDKIYEALFRSPIGQKKIVPELIESDGNYYIVKLLEIKEGEGAKGADFEKRSYLARRRGSEALDSWLNNWQKTAQIHRNQDIIRR